ncbi:MAG TPA: hypothetical protein VHU80_20495 [Polyangiaceae bacterium]|jgi:hypothetical protein|nr:hypothetical protein [Polyangiaceae bacterium]
MAALNRFVDGIAWSLSATALGLFGCGADANPGGGAPVNASVAGASAVGGAPALSGAPVVGAPGAGGATGVTVPPASATGTASPTSTSVTPPPIVGAGGATTAPVGSSGGAVAAGGTTAVTGTAGAASAYPPNGSTIGGPGDTWNVNSDLDANGSLIAPAPGDGYQIQTTTFELNPGDEVFKCYHTALANDAEFDVGHWESQMSAGSHHFILYTADTDTTPANTLSPSGCTAGGINGSTWLYTAGSPHWHLPYPAGVAVPLATHQKIVFDMHYINTGTDVIHAHVTLNIDKVKSAEFQKAAPLISFNTQIAIPPNGTQTVSGDCTPARGVSFFLMGTHTHRRGIDASITRKLANGQLGEMLVHTTNWDAPEAVLWENSPYLTFQSGEKLHYSCSYQNDRNAVTTVGSSAATNEMCMAITYFFPATAGGTCN